MTSSLLQGELEVPDRGEIPSICDVHTTKNCLMWGITKQEQENRTASRKEPHSTGIMYISIEMTEAQPLGSSSKRSKQSKQAENTSPCCECWNAEMLELGRGELRPRIASVHITMKMEVVDGV